METTSPLVPVVVSLACLSHVVTAVAAYYTGVSLLQAGRLDLVIKIAMCSFTVFFGCIGVFWDTLLYAGTYAQYHSGIRMSITDFLFTARFLDAYCFFSLTFGSAFFFLALSFNKGGSRDETCSFINTLYREMWLQSGAVCGGYGALWALGLLPGSWDLSRMLIAGVIILVCHFLIITPLKLCPTKEGLE